MRELPQPSRPFTRARPGHVPTTTEAHRVRPRYVTISASVEWGSVVKRLLKETLIPAQYRKGGVVDTGYYWMVAMTLLIVLPIILSDPIGWFLPLWGWAFGH